MPALPSGLRSELHSPCLDPCCHAAYLQTVLQSSHVLLRCQGWNQVLVMRPELIADALCT